MRNLALALLLVLAPASAEEAKRCSFALPNGQFRTFVNDHDSEGWVERMQKDNPNSRAECHALDDQAAALTLFIQTEDGQVNIQHNLTEAACYRALFSAKASRSATGAGLKVTGSTFKRGDCLRLR